MNKLYRFIKLFLKRIMNIASQGDAIWLCNGGMMGFRMLRMFNYDGKIISFYYKNFAKGKKISYMTVKIENFISRLIRHIPDKYFPIILWCGIFANRWEKQYLALASSALGQSFIIGLEKQSTPRWEERQLNYTGFIPLLYPFCKTELTFIGTVFGNFNELQYTLERYEKKPSNPSYLLKP